MEPNKIKINKKLTDLPESENDTKNTCKKQTNLTRPEFQLINLTTVNHTLHEEILADLFQQSQIRQIKTEFVETSRC